jgi:hypothetical protein
MYGYAADAQNDIDPIKMVLISHDIHDNIDHAGGISEQKRIENKNR